MTKLDIAHIEMERLEFLKLDFTERLALCLQLGAAGPLAAACLAMMADGEVFIPDATLEVATGSTIEVFRDPSRRGTVIRVSRPGCPHGDQTCPCQDGDICHYEGDNPMRCPRRPDLPSGTCGCRGEEAA